MSCSILKKFRLSIAFFKIFSKYFCEKLKKVLEKSWVAVLDKWFSSIIIFYVKAWNGRN